MRHPTSTDSHAVKIGTTARHDRGGGGTGKIDAVRRLKPHDYTTNPCLILRAMSTPIGADILSEAIQWAERVGGNVENRVIAACDRVAVAICSELTRIVPGRVSTE